jgi:hypothetical protein
MYAQVPELSQIKLPYPNPPLVKGRELDFIISPLCKGRELDFIISPLCKGRELDFIISPLCKGGLRGVIPRYWGKPDLCYPHYRDRTQSKKSKLTPQINQHKPGKVI